MNEARGPGSSRTPRTVGGRIRRQSRTREGQTPGTRRRNSNFLIGDRELPGDLGKAVLPKLDSEDWKTVVEAITLIQRATVLDPETLLEDFEGILKKLLQHACSLRSSLARGALACLGELFTKPVLAPKLGRSTILDSVLDVLVRKASLGNRFLQKNADQAITNSIQMAEGGCVKVLCSLAGLKLWKDKDKAIRMTTAVTMESALKEITENSLDLLVSPNQGQFEPTVLGKRLCRSLVDVQNTLVHLWSDQNVSWKWLPPVCRIWMLGL